MNKELTERGLSLLKQLEGLSLKAYVCDAGKATIGYGHRMQENEPIEITAKQADLYIRNDVIYFESRVNNMLTKEVHQCMFDALVIMAYNIGANALEKSTLMKNILAGKKTGIIYDNWLAWSFVNKKFNQGLNNRRKREVLLWMYGDYGIV